MKRSKLSFLLIVFSLITLVFFVAGIAAQDTDENSTPIQAFITTAQKFEELGEIQKAIEIYERIIIAAPDDLDSRVKLATLYGHVRQHDKAAQTWEKLLETDPENIKYQDEFVDSLRAAGKRNEAFEIAQAYIQTYPEIGVHYVRLAKLYRVDGDSAAVIENYKKAAAYGYHNKDIYLILAEHYFMKEDIAATEKALNNAITYTTQQYYREQIERQLVNLYRYQDKLEEKLQNAETEGTLTYEMQKQRAQHFRNTGDLDKAVIHFKVALEMTNNSSNQNEMANELINVYLKKDRTDLALDFYESEISKQIPSKLISTYFSSSGIRTVFGGDETREALINAYNNRGQLEELRTLFESKREKNTNILEMLAEIYWESNNYEKAAEAYRTLGETEPMGRKNIRSYFHAAAAFHKNNQPDMAKVVLHQADTVLASSRYKKDASFIGSLATICLKNAIYDQALKLTTDAVSIVEKGTNHWSLVYQYEILAKCYLAVERYEDAFYTYQEMEIRDDRSSLKERAKTGMNEAAKVGRLYEKWIPVQLKLIEGNPNDTELILKLAEHYEASDKLKAAIAQYERLAELEPEKIQWHRKLVDLYQNLLQTVTGSEDLSTEHLAKSVAAYEKAIELEPTSYRLYDLLAKSYIKADRTSDAEKVYRRALDASLSKSNPESAVLAIAGLYAGEGQEDKRIAVLDEFETIVTPSAALNELLGDLYQKVGDSENAELAYKKWLQIRQKELNGTQNASSHRNFADKLLDKGLYPEVALNYAKRAFFKYTSTYYPYPLTLGRACIANGLYDEALIHFKHALSLVSDGHYADMLWEEIAEAIRNANDKERYIQMLDTLDDSITSESLNVGANIYRILAQYYAENETPENAEKYLLKTGFVPESAWITLGPFNNKDSIGYFIAYIPEETTQIDTTAKYYGKDKLIRWEKAGDTKLDGRYDFGNDDGINDLCAAYVWTVVISPDERDITFRFDSDDQGFIWLNGEHVFDHSRADVGGGAAIIDRHTIPVTLKQGENTILIKVCNSTQTWDFYMRLTDTDGNPFNDLKFKDVDDLLNAPPPKPTFHVYINLGLAEYYSKNNMADKAMELMRQTGMLHENAWRVLGPFDNTVGIGYNTKYIPESTTPIDLTAKYEGVDGQISWEKYTDDAFNGFIDFGEDVNWCVSYAMATVTSPEEREVLFRFGSDDQSKIWLNGTEVFADTSAQTAILDKNTIPVTLKAGKNTILVKVCNEEMSWGFYLRVSDPDGKPIENLTINEVQEN